MTVLDGLLTKLTLRSDRGGSGKFGAKRGSRKHKGIDVKATVGQSVYAPKGVWQVDSVRTAYPNSPLKGLLFKGTGSNSNLSFKILYFKPNVKKGQTIKSGQKIGEVQDVSSRYPGQDVTNHLHIQAYKRDKLVNPSRYIFSQKKKIILPLIAGIIAIFLLIKKYR